MKYLWIIKNDKDLVMALFLRRSILLACWIFYVSGAFNYGVTRIFFALPFILPMLIFSRNDKFGFRLSLLIVVTGFIFNMTIYSNPWVFPILQKPEFIVKKDSYLHTFLGGDSSFYSEKSEDSVSFKSIELIKKGTKFHIDSISGRGGGTSTVLDIYFKSGKYNIMANPTYAKPYIETEIPIENETLSRFGNLMYYPWYPLVVLNFFYMK